MSGSTSSRFSTDADQTAGMYYEVNMGSPQTFNQIQLAFPSWASDYAPDYNVEVSSNGSSWTVVASCYGNGSPETATFPNQTDQYVEVVLNAPTPTAWWSIESFGGHRRAGRRLQRHLRQRLSQRLPLRRDRPRGHRRHPGHHRRRRL